MTTAKLSNATTGNQLPASVKKTNKMALDSSDFIKMMITQLQNQDPTQPASSDQLLAQMSQIGQLQASTQLQSSLSGLVAQNQIGSAGNLIGKSVTGLDDQNNQVTGVVNSVRVQQNPPAVYLELDNSKELPLGNVTAIAPAPAVGTSTSALLNAAKSA